MKKWKCLWADLPLPPLNVKRSKKVLGFIGLRKTSLSFIYIESYPEILTIVQVKPGHNFCPFHILFLNLDVHSPTAILSSMPLAKVRQSYLFENHSFTSGISLVRIWQFRYGGRISEIYCGSIFARSQGMRSLDEAGNLTFFSVPGGKIAANLKFFFSKYPPILLDVLHRPWNKILLYILCLTVCSSYYACRSCPLWLLVGCRKHHPLSQWLSPKQGIIKQKYLDCILCFNIAAFNCNLNWLLFWLFLLLPEVSPPSLCGSKPPYSLGQDGPSPL